jgi:glutathione S-transferase
MKLILHSYRRCPFCIRTRILLCLKKIEYEIAEEPLREWTPWMKEWSEKNNERARVPVLRVVHDNGEEHIVPESNDINLFLDAIEGKPEYTPEKDSPAYTEMLVWFDWCAKEFKPTIDLYKYGENRIFNKEKHIAHTVLLQNVVQKLEDELENRKFLIEDRMTLADIAIIPFVRQIMRTREGEFDFTPYPRVLAWAHSIIETDWFAYEVM